MTQFDMSLIIKFYLLVVFDSLWTVHIVPPVASKLGLVEESAVGAEEGSSLVTLAAIMAHVVGLEHTKRFCLLWYEIGIGSRLLDGTATFCYFYNKAMGPIKVPYGTQLRYSMVTLFYFENTIIFRLWQKYYKVQPIWCWISWCKSATRQ